MNSNSSPSEDVASLQQIRSELSQQIADMRAELDFYRTEMAALRQQVSSSKLDTRIADLKTEQTSSRRRMLKQMMAGAAGITAVTLAGAASQNAFAETANDNAIDAQGGAGGYGGKLTSDFAQLQMVPSASATPPALPGSPAHNLGELFVTSTGALYFSISTTGGSTPNAWRKIAGPGTAGSLNLLAFSDRYVDTRNIVGVNRGGKNTPFNNNDFFDFQIGGITGRDGQTVPAGALLIVGNVTVVPVGGATGVFKVLPGGTATATGTSTINFPPGVVLANGFNCALSASGQVRAAFLFGSGQADILLDVVGYYL